MGDMSELFGVSSEQAFWFFFERLEERTSGMASQPETMYVASVLAHYAQTSRFEPGYMSPSGSLYDILDTFVLPGFTAEGSVGLQDPEILEVAGSHSLLLLGFFRDQMKKRHNLRWYDSLGSSFFSRAGSRTKESGKAQLLQQVGSHFVFWTTTCRNMSRTLREERYLLRLQ